MSKLIPIEEAAKFLGLSVDRLNELRENNEVFGYRDGTTWKFKLSELERVAGQSGIDVGDSGILGGAASSVVGGVKDALGLGELGDDSGELTIKEDLLEDSGELSFDMDDSQSEMVIDEDTDSIAMEDSSIELFQPQGANTGAGTSSDILSLDDDDDDDLNDLAESGLLIKSGSKSSLLDGDSEGDSEDEDELTFADSGLNLASADDLELESEKELNLDDVGSFSLADDESVLDDDDDELSFGSSSLVLASDSAKSPSPDSTGDNLLDDEAKPSGSPSDTGNLLGDDDDDDLMLADDDLDLALADSGSFDSELSSELSSDLGDSDELVLEDESSDDLMLEANESGIALSPNESGIMLGDEPLELGGSDIDDLELPDDDDIIMVDDEADPEMATLMQEDDFSLTPHELSMDDDDSSGSQVIALADSEIYADDSEATILSGGSDFSDPAMLDEGGLSADYDPATGLVAAGAVGAGAAYGVAGGKPEAPYSLGQILGLSATVLSMFIGCIIAYGMAENLWMPDDQVVNSGLMNMLLDSLGLKS
jgi:excisionase family DNA binding protein